MEWQEYKEIKWQGQAKRGVYLLVFPNGMKYVGMSKNLHKRILTHCKNLSSPKNKTPWYSKAAETINTKQGFVEIMKQLEILIYFCDNPEEVEKELLIDIWVQGNQNLFYNTAYPKGLSLF